MIAFRTVFLSLFLAFSLVGEEVTIKLFKNAEVIPFEPLIMQLRQQEFKQFPYLLWNGDEIEQFYAAIYSSSPDGALAVAFKDDEIVGILTGVGLEYWDRSWEQFNCPMMSEQLDDLLDVKANYYLGDVIVLEKYRGQRIADRLFSVMEVYARTIGFHSTSFITVIRSSDHPQRPFSYMDVTKVWQRLGYTKSGRGIPYEWPTFMPSGELEDRINLCDIWIKQIL